jgi:hypothetical protein
VTAVVVAGIAVRFVLPLLIIVIFGVGYGPATFGEVAQATLATLGVSFVLVFAIVIPLRKWWNLAFDEEPRELDEFCPKPDEKQ